VKFNHLMILIQILKLGHKMKKEDELLKKLEPFLKASRAVSMSEKDFKKLHGRKMNENEHQANIAIHAFCALLLARAKK